MKKIFEDQVHLIKQLINGTVLKVMILEMDVLVNKIQYNTSNYFTCFYLEKQVSLPSTLGSHLGAAADRHGALRFPLATKSIQPLNNKPDS